MNQILVINLHKNKFPIFKKNNKISTNNPSKNTYFYKMQFLFSSFMIILIFLIWSFYKLSILKQEEKTKALYNNYKIYKLYSNSSETTVPEQNKENETNILGIIEIPKLNISYPFFSELSEKLLEIAPCRFYGNMPDKTSNLCIAGHNYDNNKFFSLIHNLDINDIIIIYDNFGNSYSYSVFNNYEVKSNDLSPIKESYYDKELTLVTCNNINNNRIIIKGKLFME